MVPSCDRAGFGCGSRCAWDLLDVGLGILLVVGGGLFLHAVDCIVDLILLQFIALWQAERQQHHCIKRSPLNADLFPKNVVSQAARASARASIDQTSIELCLHSLPHYGYGLVI